MIKNKKNKIFKILSFPLLASMVAIPLASCNYNSTSFNNQVDETPSKDFSDVNQNNSNSSTQNNKEELDIQVVNSKKVDNSLEINLTSSNNYGLEQNYLDFTDNGDFNQFNGNSSFVEKDILGYLHSLYYSNNESVSITNVNLSDLKVDAADNKIVFNESKISFSLSAEISANKLTNFVIEDKTFTLSQNHHYTLSIEVADQLIKPSIQKYNNNFYLAWKVEKATVSFNNQSFEISDFVITKNSFSQTFYVQFDNLSDQQTYFDLKNKYETEFKENLSQNNVKELVEQKIENDTSFYFYIVDVANTLVKEISKDEPINKIIQNATTYLLDILVKLNIIPSEFESILKEALVVNSDGTVSDKTLLEVIYNNKSQLMNLLKKYLGTAYDIVYPMIENLELNMDENNASYKVILNYVNSINNTQLKNLITGDLLGVTSSAKSLWQIVWDNFDFIISQVKGLANNNATLNSVFNLISIIFKKDNTNGNFSSIYDSILANDTNKTNFINALVGLLPSGVSEYIKILVSDNADFNKENLLKIVTSISNTLNGLFEYADNATIDTPYYERYKNITFTRTWVKDVSVDTTNSPTTSFEYKVSFAFNSEVTLDLAVIKSLVNQTVFNSLVTKLTGLTREELIKMVEEAVENAKVGSIKVNLVTPADQMIDNELAKIKQYLFDYIPDTIKLGGTGNELSLTYSADNEQIWFNPNKKGSDYYLGFSVGYDLKIAYNDPAMVNSIASKYTMGNVYYQSKYKVKVTLLTLEAIYFDYTLNYSDFWKPIIQNVFFKDYTYSSRFFLSDYSREIATTSTYNENYYYTNLEFTNKSNSVSIDEIKNLITKEDNNRNNSVTWSGTTENTNGINLVLSEDNKKQLFSKMYDIDAVNSNLNTENYYDFQFDPLLDFSTNLSFNLVARGHVKINFPKYQWDQEFQRVNLNVNLSASLYNSNIYFPVNFYDSTNKKLVTSYTKNYTSFNVATTNS